MKKLGIPVAAILASLSLLGLAAHAGAAPESETVPKSAAARIGESLPLGGAVTNPDWVHKPDGDDLARLYPVLAQIMNLNGYAVLDCGVSAAGAMQDCRIIAETPVGVGFGFATLQSATSFVMRPQTLDGQPVAGARVTIPMRWMLPGHPPTEPTAKPPEAPIPTPRLTLARQVVDQSNIGQGWGKSVEAAIDNAMQWQNQSGAVTHPVQREIAVRSLRAAGAATSSKFRDDLAKRLAARLGDEELQQIVTFLASPAGQAWNSMSSLYSQEEGDALSQNMREDARRRFCAEVECSASPTVSAARKP